MEDTHLRQAHASHNLPPPIGIPTAIPGGDAAPPTALGPRAHTGRAGRVLRPAHAGEPVGDCTGLLAAPVPTGAFAL